MLAAGTTLGSCEIIGLLGTGGMGEVYRATDRRLKRQVAIKVLPASLAADPERLARFQREAQLLAALNHPQIAAIYGLEEAGGVTALVMELVEGDDLAQRIARGPMPLAEVLAIAKQIAAALEAAHEQGIVHRDLKPANIRVRPDGAVKVLDFGLAKMIDVQPPGSGLSRSPTLTVAGMTREGMMVGTAAYMSPEQAKGRPVTRRSDVWAFGCVLFEMLTGRAAFAGESVSEVVAGVLKTEPDWHLLPPDTPPSIQRLLRRALAKDDALRLHDIADARLELDDAREVDVHAAAARPRRTERVAWIAAVAVLALLVSILAIRAVRQAPAVSALQLDVTTPPVVDPQDLGSFAISPDGETVVFAGIVDGEPQLAMRSVRAAAVQPLSGTREASYPFWSPDSRAVGFFADGELKRIDLDGRQVRSLAQATVGTGGAWNRDGVVMFSPNPASPLLRTTAAGGTPSPVTTLAPGHAGHNSPHFLPDGRHFLFFVVGSPEARGVYVGQLDDSKSTKRLMDADAPAAYMAGRLLFMRQGTLYAQEFDTTRLEVKGIPLPVTDGVLNNTGYFVTISAAGGTIAFRTGTARRQRQVVWVDRSGRELAKVGDPDNANPVGFSPSPDGSQMALFRRGSTDSDVWLLDTRRGVLSRFTTTAGEDIFPAWSRDGSRIAYTSNRNGCCEVYQKLTGGSGAEELLVAADPFETFPSDWSPDDRMVLFQRRSLKSGWDIWTLPVGGGGKPLAAVQTDGDDRDGRLSPDGKWIVYVSNTSGRFEVYVQAFPARFAAVQVSPAGGMQVRWRADGRELYYVAFDGRLMAVPITLTANGSTIDLGTPAPLFTPRIGHLQFGGPHPEYVPSADGQRFLLNTIVQDSSPTPIRLVVNWMP